MILPYRELLKKLAIGRWALPTFNTFNVEMTQGIIAGAEKENAPIVIEISKRSLLHAGGRTFLNFVYALAEAATVPIALHFDHAETINDAKSALKLPFSSLMVSYDLNASLERNIKSTKKMSDLAKRRSFAVQGEVGRITGPKYNWRLPEHWLTDPQAAARYAAETNVDALAISIGNRHGIAAGSVRVDLKRLKAIRSTVDVPLVLHGGSGLRLKTYPQVIKEGIAIINFDTDLRFTFSASLRDSFKQQQNVIDPRPALNRARTKVAQVVATKIRVCGASKRAPLW
jgi:ketose-bisphosphate aldolase